jgi:glycosyltransferase involved in cell wall biosynthesis
MSEALASTYGCPPPAVIYNAFPWADRDSIDGRMKDRSIRQVPSIHWYSQMIGRGRGLEDLLAALPHVKHEVEIHLRGMPVLGFDDWLSARVPQKWRHRVFVHSLVPNDELLSRISEHDIGFAGEMKFSMSRNLTVTNKILHYLLAGLAVVASDTVGQQEVASRAHGAVLLYPSGDAPALAAQINRLLASPELLERTKACALLAARETFCWEQQEKTLLGSAVRAVGEPARYVEAPL